MSDRNKLFLQIAGFVAVILILAWAIWATFFRAPGTSLVPGGTAPAVVGQLPGIGPSKGGNIAPEAPPSLLQPEPAPAAAVPDRVASGGRTRTEALTQDRANFPALASNGFNYYNDGDGRFYRVSPNGGEPVAITDDVFNNVEKVTWAGAGDKAVLEFPDGANIYYNFQTKERATLPKAARDFSFTVDGDSLGYKYLGEGQEDRWLVASDPDGSGQQLIQPLINLDDASNVQVNWSPEKDIVATYRESTSALGEEVFFLGLNNENFRSLQTNGLGFKGKWSPTGQQMLYSVFSPKTDWNPSLYIAGAELDNIGEGNRSLRLATWPEKCVFASETLLYCAVPQNLEQGSGLYPELANTVPDVIYKVDLASNLSTPLAYPESSAGQNFTVENLMMAPDGRDLYFTDRATGRLEKLRLR